MNLRDLEYLVALADLKHFRKAAERCFVSQPTLSGQLRKLEEELGVNLVERSSRKVLFTKAGQVISEQARKVLLEARVIKDLAASFKEPMAGPLHIGFIPTIAPYLLPLIVSPLRHAFPLLELYLYEEQTQKLLQKLDDGQLDCALLAELPGMEHYGKLPVYDETLELAVHHRHPLARRRRVPLAVLKGERVLMLEDGHCLRDQAKGFCFAAGADEDPSFKATSLETLRHMVSTGAGLTLMPKLAIPLGVQDSTVSYIPFEDPRPSRHIVLLFRPSSVRQSCFEGIGREIHRQVLPHLA